MTKKILRMALRQQIVTIGADGARLGELGNRPRKEMVELGLADVREVEGETRLFLTAAGEAIAEILAELKVAFEACDRMRDSAVNGILETRPSKTAAPAHLPELVTPRRGPEKPEEGSFLAKLNAAGLNSWSLNPQHGRNVCPKPSSNE